MAEKKQFGLIGFPLSHSFSEKYFSEKFEKEGIKNSSYKLFPIEKIEDFPDLLKMHPDLVGLNVTIPYKEKVISYLSGLDEKTADIQAVNVVKKMPDGTWKGYNSDYFGFLSTLSLFGNRDFWKGKKALIFGTGGSSKAVQVALNDLGVFWQSVSRTGTDNFLSYESIENSILESASLLVNCTPLGMFPNVENCVPIQFEMLGSKHIVIDLVYNPTETLFMQRAAAKGAKVCNGLHMLKAQAEKAWEIWQSQD